MDPTMTEHDFRFPRRPHHPGRHDDDGGDYDGLTSTSSELSKGFGVANNDLLGSALFPSLDNAADDSPWAIDEMQKDDPLAAQVWKFFAKTKQQLPNQQRLENLTWRMMALSMRKKKQEDEARQYRDHQTRYVAFLYVKSHTCETKVFVPRYRHCPCVLHHRWAGILANKRAFFLCPARLSRLNRPATHNAPSGIAQLRKTSEINAGTSADAMNLDDFIFSDHVATPSSLMSPPPAPKLDNASPRQPSASGILIKSRKDPVPNHFVPQSVPHHQRSSNNEFHYVQRHHRKTSIDERRVSTILIFYTSAKDHACHLHPPPSESFESTLAHPTTSIAWFDLPLTRSSRTGNDLPTFRPMCSQSAATCRAGRPTWRLIPSFKDTLSTMPLRLPCSSYLKAAMPLFLSVSTPSWTMTPS
jgi:GATA-binding protein